MSEQWERGEHPAQAEVHEPLTEFDGPIGVTPEHDLTQDDWREAARAIYCGHGGSFSDGDVDVDADARVSESEQGAYVAAWVWVARGEV